MAQIVLAEYVFQVEVCVRVHKIGLDIAEEPITIVGRLFVESKLG